MEDFITRPIGEKFDYEGDMLEVVEEKGCKNCYFYDITFCRFEDTVAITGFCVSDHRGDKKDVIFKEVE